MNISRLIGLVFCLLVLPHGFVRAQDVIVSKSSIVEQYKGKPYYVHFVKQGETLLAISKTYKVSIDEIQAENPSLQKGLQYDMVLRIPNHTDSEIEKSSHNPVPVNNTGNTDGAKIVTYTVEKKETLYGIARKFNITVDELLKANPEATHLKEGMVLTIPPKFEQVKALPRVEKMEPVDTDAKEVTVKAGETLYSIAKQYRTTVDTLIALNPELIDGLKTGMVLRLKRLNIVNEENVKVQNTQVNINEPSKPKSSELACFKSEYINETYNIALLLPFALEDVIEQPTESDAAPKATDECFAYYQLYAGFMLAVDSLQKYGLHAKVYVYDADKQGDTLKIKSVLRKPELAKMDLIVGPLFAGSFPIAARFAKKHSIPIVNPFSQRENLVVSNPYVMKIKPAKLAIADKLVSHIASKYADCNVVAVSFDMKENAGMITRFNDKLTLLKQEKVFSGKISKVNMADSKMTGVIQALDPDKRNIVIYFSDNKSSVPNFVSLLNAQKGSRDVVLIGMDEWSDIELETEFLVNLNFEQVAISSIDFSSRRVLDFSQQFLSKYKAKPQVSQNAFLGFDLGWYYLTSLMWYGAEFQNCLQYNTYKGLEYDFDFRIFKDGDGMQNSTVHILKLENYKMVKVD